MFGLTPPPRMVLRRSGPIKNPSLLNARKKFDLPTECISFLNLEKKYRKISLKTIKLLLSQHAKKMPFGKVTLASKVLAVTKTIGRNVKNFSYYMENQYSKLLKPEIKLLRLIGSAYKHLEHPNVSSIDVQDKSSLSNISKLNHLQSLSIKLFLGKPLPSPHFFQSVKHLRHISLSITESPQNNETDFAPFAGFFYSLTLLPFLESYSMHIHTAFSEKSENFVKTVFYYLNLLKVKRFSVEIYCSEDIDLKFEKFSSFLESVDTLEYRYMQRAPSQTPHFQASTSKKLILFLKPAEKKQPLTSLANLTPSEKKHYLTSLVNNLNPFEKNPSLISLINVCTSLENLYLEQRKITVDLNLPQTLRSLVLAISSQSPKTCKFWGDMLSSLKNLESLSLFLRNPDLVIENWVSQLPKHASLQNLKRYHLKLESDTTPHPILQPGVKLITYDSFLTKWSKGIQCLENLEDLTFDITFVLLKSLDFFIEAIASLPKLKNIKLNLLLHGSQPEEFLKFFLHPQGLPSPGQIERDISQYLAKDSVAKLLQDILNRENLQSFSIKNFVFDEETTLSTLKGLSSLKGT